MILPYVQPASEIPPWPPTGHIPDPVCRACGWVRMTTNEPDGCLGCLPDTRAACCGHGRLYLKDGEIFETTEIWLNWQMASIVGNYIVCCIGFGPSLHLAFDAWRDGDVGLFGRIIGFLVAEHIRESLGDRLTSEGERLMEVERAAYA